MFASQAIAHVLSDLRRDHLRVDLKKVETLNGGVTQITDHGCDVDLTTSVEVEKRSQLIVKRFSDHDASVVLKQHLQV